MYFNQRLAIVVLLVLASGLTGCRFTKSIPGLTVSETQQPDIGSIYNRAAQYHDGLRNPVIVIPGILGTRLVDQDSGRTVWGEVDKNSIDPEDRTGARIVAYPLGQNVPLSHLKDSVVQDGAVGRVRVEIAGFPVEQQAYGEILTSLGVGGYRDQDSPLNSVDYGGEHFTCFQFSYDWRRDNSENAALLSRFIKDRAQYVRRERERRFGITDQPVRFDIVAHSMGGLIARYYMRFGDQPLTPDGPPPVLNWAGCDSVDRLVLVGTPNAGSAKAFVQAVEGRKLGPLLPTYQPAVLGSMPSLYQLMPRNRHAAVVSADNRATIDLYDVVNWDRYGWGLLNPDQDKYLRYLLPDTKSPGKRRDIAREHVAKCLRQAKKFHSALDYPASPPRGTTLHLIAGDAELTDSRIAVERSGALKVDQQVPGDSTVTRRSALMDERDPNDPKWTPQLVTPIDWHSVNFFFAGHIELTSNIEFTDNLLYLLLEAPRKPRSTRTASTRENHGPVRK